MPVLRHGLYCYLCAGFPAVYLTSAHCFFGTPGDGVDRRLPLPRLVLYKFLSQPSCHIGHVFFGSLVLPPTRPTSETCISTTETLQIREDTVHGSGRV